MNGISIQKPIRLLKCLVLAGFLQTAQSETTTFENPLVSGIPTSLPVWSGFSPVVLQYGDGAVQDAVAGAGTQALEVSPGAAVAWSPAAEPLQGERAVTTFLVRHDVFSTDAPVIPAEELSTVLFINDTGLMALDGNTSGGGNWQTLQSLTPGVFYQVSITSDYATMTYDVEINGSLVADDFGFKDPITNSSFLATFESSGQTWLDDVSASFLSESDPPTPDPMTWATLPAAYGSEVLSTDTSIRMIATTATDPSGVEYSFECISGGGHDSGWQESPEYIDTGLSPSTSYTYRTRARDKSRSQNTTEWSAAATATTTTGAPPPAQTIYSNEDFEGPTIDYTEVNGSSETAILDVSAGFYPAGSDGLIMRMQNGSSDSDLVLNTPMTLVTDEITSLTVAVDVYFDASGHSTSTANKLELVYSALGDFSDTTTIQIFSDNGAAAADLPNYLYTQQTWFTGQTVTILPGDVTGGFTDTAKIRWNKLGSANKEKLVFDNVVITGSGAVGGNDFSDWIDTYFPGETDPAIIGLDADPDGDRLGNGLEAWFGTDPGAFNVGLVGLANDGLTTTFEHPQNETPPTDLSGFYEWSPNLADWYADGSGPGGGPPVSFAPATTGTTTTVTTTASEPLERLFLRIGVIQN